MGCHVIIYTRSTNRPYLCLLNSHSLIRNSQRRPIPLHLFHYGEPFISVNLLSSNITPGISHLWESPLLHRNSNSKAVTHRPARPRISEKKFLLKKQRKKNQELNLIDTIFVYYYHINQRER